MLHSVFVIIFVQQELYQALHVQLVTELQTTYI